MVNVRVANIVGPEKRTSKSSGKAYNVYKVTFEIQRKDGTWGKLEDASLTNNDPVKVTFKEIDDCVKGNNKSFPYSGTARLENQTYQGKTTIRVADLKLEGINRPQAWSGNGSGFSSSGKTYQRDTTNPQMQTSIEKQVALKAAVEAFPWHPDHSIEGYLDTVLQIAQAFYDRFLDSNKTNNNSVEVKKDTNGFDVSDFDTSNDAVSFNDDEIPFQ